MPAVGGQDGRGNIGTAGDGAQKVGAVGPVDQPSALLQGLEAAESEGGRSAAPPPETAIPTVWPSGGCHGPGPSGSGSVVEGCGEPGGS